MTSIREIDDVIAFHGEPAPAGQTQDAWYAQVHVLLPSTANGVPVDEAAASDWLAELLRGNVLDWGYVRAGDPDTVEPGAGSDDQRAFTPIVVSRPYQEGTFLTGDTVAGDSAPDGPGAAG